MRICFQTAHHFKVIIWQPDFISTKNVKQVNVLLQQRKLPANNNGTVAVDVIWKIAGQFCMLREQ